MKREREKWNLGDPQLALSETAQGKCLDRTALTSEITMGKQIIAASPSQPQQSCLKLGPYTLVTKSAAYLSLSDFSCLCACQWVLWFAAALTTVLYEPTNFIK
jgi:hypothetical protein